MPRAYAAFAVPLGATTKMDGCAAIYPAISAIFVAQFYGVPLHLADYGLIAFVSVVGSAATAGLTGATVIDRGSVVITHLSSLITDNAARLLSREDVRVLTESVKQISPAVVDELI